MKELLRRVLRSFIVLALRLRSRPLTPDAVSRCLVIAPHQDDEALGCSGLIIACRAANLPVEIVYLTDGAGSHQGHPRLQPQDIASLRHAEAVQAMRLLGVAAESLHFIDAADGTLAHLTTGDAEEIAQRLAPMLTRVQPSVILLPCRADGSSEHTAAFQLTQCALQIAQLSPRLLEYPIWAMWSPLRLIHPGLTSRRVWHLSFPESVALKRTTLATYRSQMEPTPPWIHPVLPAGFARCFAGSREFFFEQ